MRLGDVLASQQPARDDVVAQMHACIAAQGNMAEALQQCTAQQLAVLMASPRMLRRLAEHAARCDHPEALTALQHAEAAATCKPSLTAARVARLRREAVHKGGVRSAVAAVRLAELSVDAFCQQFPKAQQAWSSLVEQRLLTPQRFVTQFGWPSDAIGRWRAAGVLPDAMLSQWASGDAERMAQSLSSGACTPSALIASAPRGRQPALIATLLAQGARVEGHLHPPSRNAEHIVWQALTSGVVDADTYLATVGEVPAFRRAAFAQRIAAGDVALLFRAGCLDDDAICTQLQQGGLSAAYVLDNGVCSDVVVGACLRAAPIAQHALMQATLRVWRPHHILPQHHRHMAQDAKDIGALVALLPRHPNAATHRAYVLRMAAAFAEYQLLHRGAQALLPSTNAPHAQASACLICLTPFAAELPRLTLRDCNHPQEVCVPCNRALFVKSPDAFGCMTKGCARLFNPEDGLVMGLDPHRVAWRVIQRWRRTQPQHLPCVRATCVGGADVDDAASKRCPVCTTPLPLPVADTYEVQKAYLTRLVTSVGAQHGKHVLVRECYHCGVATERGEGCAHIRCTQCEGDWHFSRGSMSAAAPRGLKLAEGVQSYVPHKGLLVRLGFYAGTTPGQTHVRDLEARLQTRLAAYTPEVHQDAFARAIRAPALKASAP